MTTGRGNINGHKQEQTKAVIKRKTSNALNEEKYKIFKGNVLYNTLTGHELGSVSKSMTMIAEPKHVAVDEEFGDRQLEMSGLLGLDESSMNYEIIVPWLMRNIKKRASDLASKDDPLVLLREMVDDIAGDDTLTLIAPQFRLLLAKLGIKVTKDVIREVCRMYSGEAAIVNQKWRLSIANAHKSAVDEKGRDRSDTKAETREDKFEKSSAESKHGHSASSVLFGEEEDLGVNMRRYSSHLLVRVLIVLPQLSLLFRFFQIRVIEEISSGRALKSVDGLLRGKTIQEVRRTEFLSESKSLDTQNLITMNNEKLNSSDKKEDEKTESATNVINGVAYELEKTESNGGFCFPPAVSIQIINKLFSKAVNIQDAQGRTPLFIAVAHGLENLISAFVFHGADITIQTQSGLSPIIISKLGSGMQKALVKWLSHNKCGNKPSARFSMLPDLIDDLVPKTERNDLEIAGIAEIRQIISDNVEKPTLDTILHDLKSYADLLTKPKVSDYLIKHDITLDERTLDLIFTIFENDDKGAIQLSDFITLFQCDNTSKENLTILEEGHFISRDGFAWTRAPSEYSSSDIQAYRVEETLVSLKDQLAHLQKRNWCYSRSPIAYAVACGSVKLVRQFLATGSNPNEADSMGRTPIHFCASLSQTAYFSDSGKLQENENSFNVEVILDIIEALVEKGAHVNALTCSNRTALHECFCSSENESTKSAHSDVNNLRAKSLVVRRLLQWGADPAILDRKGVSAIHYCCQEDNVSSLLEFIQHYKLQPKKLLNLVSTNGRNVLHSACFSGAFSCAKLLCRWDADNFGQSSLRSAEDKLGKIPTLLLPPHIQRSSLDNLWDAALSGQTMKINVILNAKASKSQEPTWENVEGEDNLDCTKASAKNAKYGDIWTVSGIDSKSRRLLWSAIHFTVYGWIVLAADQGSKCAKRLVPRKHARISSTGTNYGGSLAMLLSRNAYVDSLDYKCRTALMLSAAANLVDAISLLIDHGANPNCSDINGNTPLHYAYAFGASSAVITLEARGANDSKENFSSCTPIEMAGKGSSLLPIYH